MEIVLALLRTLVFVVATVAATVYVSRRIGRGRPLLWTGTTLLALYWLVLFGWTSYLTGTTNPSPDLSIWVGWGGHLLPFFAALAYIWGIGQAAGFPSRAGAGAGAALGKSSADTARPAQPAPAGGSRANAGGAAADAGSAANTGGAGANAGGSAATPVTGGTRPEAAKESVPGPAGTKGAAQPFPAPHAVPVVTTPPESPAGQGAAEKG